MGVALADRTADLADAAQQWAWCRFGPGGALQRALGDGFEARVQQLRMAAAVWRVLQDGGVALLEAGTGTGKSLAYLIPLLEALGADGRRRAVVATYTLHLQHQLVEQDLPVAQTAAGVSVPAAVAKGWGNYVCLWRLERLCRQPELALAPVEPSAAGQLQRLWAWVNDGGSGDRADRPEGVEASAWAAVAADPDRCARRRCPFYEACPYFRARQRLQQAQLVVTNHHLLVADLCLRREASSAEVAVLPDFDHLVVDEAHHLEDVAVSHLGLRLSERALLGRLQRLVRWHEGALAACGARAEGAARALFDELRRWAAAAPAGTAGESRPVRWHPDRRGRRSVEACLEQVQDAFVELAHAAFTLAGGMGGVHPQAETPADDPLQLELAGLGRWADRTAVQLDLLVQAEDREMVFWLEPEDGPGLILRGAPVDVAAVLGGQLLAPRRACVLTSATLVGDAQDFAGLRRRLGLAGPDEPGWQAAGEAPAAVDQDAACHEAVMDQPEHGEDGLARLRVGRRGSGWLLRQGSCTQGIFPAPFDYLRQVRLGVPLDVVDPDHPGFAAALADGVARLASRIGGRSFVLFTSFSALEQVAHELSRHPQLQRAGLEIVRQGQAPRERLLERFRQARGEGLVLLGTDSFWEGVDVPGPALSLVVLARLPFPVPDHPLVQARAERLREAGRDPFREEALPRAVLKFRQGFGRLVRRASDAGAVVVWDRRLLMRPYGRCFLSALPPCLLVAGPVQALVEELSGWIARAPR